MFKPYEEKYKVKNIINSVKTLLLIENCYGVFRYQIILRKKKQLKLCGIIIPLVVIGLYLFFNNHPKDVSIEGKVFINLTPTIIIFQYLATTILACCQLSYQNIQIFNKIKKIDSNLYINSIRDFYAQERLSTKKAVIAIVLFHITQNICHCIFEYKIQQTHFVVMIAYVERNLEIVLFCRLIYMLTNRLCILNNYLMILSKKTTKFSITKNKQIKFTNIGFEKSILLEETVQDKSVLLKALTTAYDGIGETLTIINKLFNFQLLMTLLSAFTVSILTTSVCLRYFLSLNCYISLINIIIWVVVEIFYIALISCVCEGLFAARRSAVQLIEEIIMNNELSNTTLVEAKLLREFVEVWPLKVVVYDMFTVNFKLILKFISVGTTYLIIVTQITNIM